MELLEIIKTRRSIRRFQPKEIPQAALEQILEAIRWAPSWNNTQCWEVILVRNSNRKAELLECVPKFNPGYKAIGEAPLLLVIFGKLKSSGYYQGASTTKHGDWFLFDLGLATQNACLTAHSLGLGTVIVGLFDHDGVKGVLCIPAGYEVVALLPVGYPAHQPSHGPRRKETPEFMHEESFH